MEKAYNHIDIKSLYDNAPKDEWKCDLCGHISTEWMPSLATYLRSGKVVYIHKPCKNCKKIQDKREEAYEKEKRKQKIQKIITKSHIPPKLYNCNINSLNVNNGAELAFKTMAKLKKADRWIYIHGTNNTGKSSLAVATLKQLAENMEKVFYFNEVILFSRIKDAYNRKTQETENDIISLIRQSKYIFWDDFSTSIYTDWELKKATEILEICDSENKIIIFTSNVNIKGMNEEDIITRIGKRPYARIKRNNIFYIEMKNKPFY